MRFPRRSGILLHITSLPGSFGIGDLGEPAFRFIEFLQRAGQHIWQVLPLGPTARGNSPYTCFSAFAGNPLLISLTRLVEEGFLAEQDFEAAPAIPRDEVEFDAVTQLKNRVLEQSFAFFSRQASSAQRDELNRFCQQNRWWLDDFALFLSLTREFNESDWSQWDSDLVHRSPAALAHWTEQLEQRIQLEKYIQFLFDRQWHALRSFANERNVQIFGDLPIFVAYESADVWMHQDLFFLDQAGERTVVAGVPPDYFSAAGQLWGNPLYRWQHMAATGYDWWVRRLRHDFSWFDMVRIDHFRGFEAYWEVPAAASTAAAGHWVNGPGAAPFRAAEARLGKLRIVAEDLGLITDDVHRLREELHFPGMRVFQFGFDDADGAYHRPEHYPEHCVAYTGTHDNDTAMGWFRKRTHPNHDSGRPVDEFLLSYLGAGGQEPHWEMIRRIFASPANTAIVPLQDLLGLGSEARMNVPGDPDGNWKWRCRQDVLTTELAERLRQLTVQVGRCEG